MPPLRGWAAAPRALVSFLVNFGVSRERFLLIQNDAPPTRRTAELFSADESHGWRGVVDPTKCGELKRLSAPKPAAATGRN